MTDKKPKTF